MSHRVRSLLVVLALAPAVVVAVVGLRGQDRPALPDASRPINERVAALLDRMTMEENIAQLQAI